MRLINILILTTVFAHQGIVKANTEQATLSELKWLIEQRWDIDEPGGAVIIMKNGATIFEAYRGLSNLEQKKPITANTIFQYASVTKRLTAATILSFVKVGDIELDKPIGSYLIDLKAPIATITIRQLLTHSSGIPSNFDFEYGTNYSTDDHLQKISTLDLQFEPGTKSAYSNNGYNLLGALLEEITGKPWYKVIVDHVTKPLNLSSIQYLQKHINSGNDIAIGYYENLLNYSPAPQKTASLLHANGAFSGTLRDLASWVYSFHEGRVIPPYLLDMAYEKRKLPSGDTGWAMGLFRFDYHGHEVMVHDGSVNGSNAFTIYLPSLDIAIATATNTPSDAGNLAYRIAGNLLGAPIKAFRSVPFTLDTVAPDFGSYKYPSGREHHIFLNNGNLFFQNGTQSPDRLLYAGDHTYFLKKRSHWFKVENGPDGIKTISYHPRGRDEPDVGVKTQHQ